MALSATSEIVGSYFRGLHDLAWPAWAVLAAAPFLAFLRRAPDRARRWAPLLAGLVVLGGLALAWQLRWIGDDAYISFRFARNLAEGHGLVFNPGERVEGYTDFLWTLLLSGAISLGIHPVFASLALSLGSFAVAMLVVDRVTLLLEPPGEREPRSGEWPTLGLLLCAGGLLLASHATSGLTTMFAATLVLLAYWQSERGRPLLAACLAIAATLAHPDHGLFYAAIGAALLVRREKLRVLLLHAAPFFLVFVPYFLWRWHYYGDFVPNTFRTKSADVPYYSQGFVYAWASAWGMGLFAMLPLAAVGAWAHRRSRFVIASAVGLPAFIVYTARVGGDFMIGRFLVTPALLLIVLASLGFERLVRSRPVLASALGALALTAVLPVRVVQPQANRWGLADEGSWYPLVSLSPPRVDSVYADEADTLVEHLVSRGLRPKLATDCVGIVGYETRLPIFDLYGLTSREVAANRVWERARPGHEKYGTPAQVVASGAELSKIPAFPGGFAEMTRVSLGAFRYFLPAYRSPLGPALASDGRTRDAHAMLAEFGAHLGERPPGLRPCDAWFAREYYFRWQHDEPLERAWARGLGGELPEVDAIALLLRGDDPAQRGYAETARLGFGSDLGAWTGTGSLAGPPVAEAVRNQLAVVPVDGAFADSFVPGVGDGPTGQLVSPAADLDADLVTFWVAGGGAGQAVNLVRADDGAIVRTTCACQSDTFRREAWDVSALRGTAVRFEIVDGVEGVHGGHVMVDDVRTWRRTAAPARP